MTAHKIGTSAVKSLEKLHKWQHKQKGKLFVRSYNCAKYIKNETKKLREIGYTIIDSQCAPVRVRNVEGTDWVDKWEAVITYYRNENIINHV